MISLSAAFAIGGAALAGWNSVAMTGGDCCVLLSADAELEQMVQAKDAAAVAAASSRVEVVAILKNDITAEASWEVWLANMALAASLGAVDKTVLVTWLANFHVASSSAKVARSFVLDDYDESEEDGEGETLYLFYLRSGTHDAQHGCMQVRVCGDVLTIDALCSLGNHSSEAFMKHLVAPSRGAARQTNGRDATERRLAHRCHIRDTGCGLARVRPGLDPAVTGP